MAAHKAIFGFPLTLLVAGFPVCGLVAQIPDKETTMPQILQYGLGPGGTGLPDDGSMYCGPTSMTMNIGWLGLAGHSRLAPTTAAEQTEAFFLNLDRTLGGLSEAEAYGGTTVSSLLKGVSTYLKMKGYSGSFTAATGGLWGPSGNGGGTGGGVTTPNLSDLTSIADSSGGNLNFGSFLVGWYDVGQSVWQREGGHFLAIVATSSPDTVVINNPYPNTGVPIQQTVILSDVAAGTQGESGGPPAYSLAGYLNASEGMQYPIGGTMPPGYNTPVIEQWLRFSVPETVPAVATWNLDEGANDISVGLGHQEVLAPVADAAGGTSSFIFSGGGTLTFTREATYSGGTTVAGSILESTENSGSPFGSGDLALESGTAVFKPRGSGGNVQLAMPGTISSSGGSTLALELGSQSGVTLTAGGFSLQNGGSLQIAVDAAALGTTAKILVSGTAPAVSGGMVGAGFVGQDSSAGAHRAGFFLTYDPTDGFVAATAETGDINSLAGAPIYAASSNQTVAGGATVSLKALSVTGATISGAADTTLAVGGNASGGAGIILNGGTVEAGTVSLGSSPGYVYSDERGGTINSAITGASDLRTLGPGTTTLGGNTSIAGQITVQTGTLLLAASGSASAAGITVGDLGTFAQYGAAGSATSAVPWAISGTRTGSGDIYGNVTVAENGQFSGTGTVTGTTEIRGTLGDLDDISDPGSYLTFVGDVTFAPNSFYNFNLKSLTDFSLNDFFTVDGTLLFQADSGAGTYAEMGILFDGADDPSTGNSFWSADQIFQIASATTLDGFSNLSLNVLDYANGYFWIGHSGGTINLHWHAVPEPTTIALAAAAALLVGAASARGRRRVPPSDRRGDPE